MYVHGVQCDNCTKIYNTDIIHIDALPGWVKLEQHKQSLLHFCSFHCLHEWVEKHMPVVEEVGNPDHGWRDL